MAYLALLGDNFPVERDETVLVAFSLLKQTKSVTKCHVDPSKRPTDSIFEQFQKLQIWVALKSQISHIKKSIIVYGERKDIYGLAFGHTLCLKKPLKT